MVTWKEINSRHFEATLPKGVVTVQQGATGVWFGYVKFLSPGVRWRLDGLSTKEEAQAATISFLEGGFHES